MMFLSSLHFLFLSFTIWRHQLDKQVLWKIDSVLEKKKYMQNVKFDYNKCIIFYSLLFFLIVGYLEKPERWQQNFCQF